MLRELPKLSQLTLASAIGGGGGTGGGGSTVFGVLLAVFSLALLPSCYSDRSMEPGTPESPKALVSIPCIASVEAKSILCGGPLNAPGQEVLGGQGYHVVLRSSNVGYDGTDFTFDATVQNLSTQSIGTDGSLATGLSVFFVQEPTVTSGTGTITVQNAGLGTFTATDQLYYAYPDSLGYQQISAPQTWTFTMPATVTTFSFTVMVAAVVPDQGGVLKWESVAGLSRGYFYDVASAGPNEAVAVGDYGTALKWDGAAWTALPATTNDALFGVAAIAPGEYVVAGNEGRLFRLKGKIWTEVHQRADTLTLDKIWVRNSGHFVAVGNNGAVTVYNGGTFTDLVIDPTEPIDIIAGTADGSAITAATRGGASWVSGDGGLTWGVTDSLLDATEYLFDVAYDADNKRILSYLDLVSFEGVIVHDGSDTVFLATDELPARLHPFDRDSLVVQVFDLNVDFGGGGVYTDKLRYGGAPEARFTFTDTALTALLEIGESVALDAAKTQLLFASDAGDLWFRNGGNYTRVQEWASCGCFSGIWGIEDTTFIVDGTTALWKVVDGTYTQLTAPAGAYKIWGLSSTELYILADSTVWKGDGVGGWTEEYVMIGNGDLFTDIWGDAASGNLIVLGDGGRWRTRVSGVWGEGASLGMNVSGVWGCSGSQAWIVSQDGGVFNWDGGTGATADPAYTYAPWFHRSITGSSCSDVWIGGPSNELFHWDGAAWDSVWVGGPFLNVEVVHSKGAGEVYVGGDQGMAALVRPSGGTYRMPIPNQGLQIIGLWQLLNGELISLDEENVMRGVR